MAKHRTHSVEFKRQVSQEYLSGETLHGLSKRHNVSRTQIRIRLRETLCRFESPCSVSPLRYSCDTCRLNSTLWVRCFAMGLHPLKARPPGQLLKAIPSAPRGPLQKAGNDFRSTPCRTFSGFVGMSQTCQY